MDLQSFVRNLAERVPEKIDQATAMQYHIAINLLWKDLVDDHPDMLLKFCDKLIEYEAYGVISWMLSYDGNLPILERAIERKEITMAKKIYDIAIDLKSLDDEIKESLTRLMVDNGLLVFYQM